MSEEKKLPNMAETAARRAAEFIQSALEQTDLSLMELAVVFRIAATTCDECHSMNERVHLASKLRGWRPGQ